VKLYGKIVRAKSKFTKRLRPKTVNLLQRRILLRKYIPAKTTNDTSEATMNETTDSSRNDRTEGWQSPKRTRKMHPATTIEKLELKNTYEPLKNTTDVNEDNLMDTTAQEQRTKEKLPPPIIVHGFFKNHLKLTTTLRNSIGNQYTIKYTRYNTNIYTRNKSDWTKIQKVLKNDNIDFHTYTHKTEKTHAFVLRGLHQGPTAKEVAEALQTEKVEAQEIYCMRGTKWPAYLIVTDKLEQIKFILNTKVSWQRHINNKIFVQCHRCQRWGHATANCHAQAKCVKCAGDHLTRDCQLGNKITPKCVNCDGDHTANNIKCPEYQKKLEAAQKRRKRNTKNEKYVPAPLPKENAWEKRKKNTGSERAESSYTERKHSTATPSTESVRTSTQSTQPIGNSQGNTSELFAQIKRLNSLCNISNLIRALTDLNNLLTGAKSSDERFMTVLQFTQNITKYDI
jgi:hypothetical protein